MKKLALVLLLSLRGFALDNSVRITNNFTSALTTHPISFARVFARGEIANFPKPYARPSNTGVRAAVTTWQSTELIRWNDTSAARNITAARAGAPSWSSSAGGGITSIVVAANIATITFTSAHNLAVGDRLVVIDAPSTSTVLPYGTTTDSGLISNITQDNMIVHEVTDSTHVKYLTRIVTTGTYPTAGTVVQVYAKIDPQEPTDVCRITMANHGFYVGDPVTITSIPGMTILNPASDNVYYVTKHTRDIIVTNARCSGTYTSGGTVTGTSIGAGSIRHARVAMFTTIPSAGYTDVDFENSTNPCSSGNAAACTTAGFDKAEMLAYETTAGNDWNFNVVATAPVKSGATAAFTTNLRTMLNDSDTVLTTPTYCKPRIEAVGPVETIVTLEYGCPSDYQYDFGWKIRPGTTFASAVDAADTEFHVTDATNIDAGTNLHLYKSTGGVETVLVGSKFTANSSTLCDGVAISTGYCLTGLTRAVTGTAGTYASARGIGIRQWEDGGDAYKSLHPVGTLRYITGWAGVGGRIEMFNEYAWKQQNFYYSVDIQTGDTPATKLSKTSFKHIHSTSWALSTWDGADPDFYCSGGSGTNPDNCSGSGGGTRKRKYLIDHNTPYLIYAHALPEWRMYTGKSTALDSMKTGFQSSDMGEITSTTLGKGTWGAQPSDPGISGSNPIIDGQGEQEAFTVNDIQAMWLQNWSESGYEITFCDSCPGNAGNVEVWSHAPVHVREDDDTTTQPRYIMPGFASATLDRASNRAVSTYTRPFFLEGHDDENGSAAATAPDKRRTACSASAAPQLLPGDAGAGASGGTQGWYCYYFKNGLDGWTIDSTQHEHQQIWEEIPYMITGDRRYLEILQSSAGWNGGFENGANGRGLGRSWSQPDGSTQSPPRKSSGWVAAMTRASLWTPNVPQFGFTVPSVMTFYYNEKLWDMGQAKEGAMQIRDGWFATFYPHIDLTTAPTVTAQKGATIWHQTRYKTFLGEANPLGLYSHNNGTVCENGWLNCATYNVGAESGWKTPNGVISWGRAEANGNNAFYHARRKYAKFQLSMYGSDNWNPYMNALSTIPNRDASTGAMSLITTITGMYNGLSTSWTGIAAACSPKTSNTWCLTANTQYIVQSRAQMASLGDLNGEIVGDLDGCSADVRTPAGCTWSKAWSFINSTVPEQGVWNEIVKFILEPHAEINDLTCVPGGVSIQCFYTAPTLDACTYATSTTAFANSIDTTDTSDGGGAQQRNFLVASLSPSTLYYVRLTCGQRNSERVLGTARTTTTVTTVTAGSGTTHTVTIPALTGATKLVVTYGATSGLGSTMSDIACTSGCTANIPGTENTALYFKLTRKTAGDVTVAASGTQKVIVQ